jgi:hypothetical protein
MSLATRLPAAVALGLQRPGALAGIKLLPPGETTLAAELVRLSAQFLHWAPIKTWLLVKLDTLFRRGMP